MRTPILLLCLATLAGAAGAGEPAPVAFTLPERDLLPENVAFDPATGHFFVGSTRKGKIVRYRDGVAEDFVPARAHGLWMVIGMKADPGRRALWVASSAGSNLEDPPDGPGGPAGLFRFDLDTGALEGRWLLDDGDTVHFLNDLVVAPNGDVYVTHMFDAAAIYRLDAATGTFSVFLRGDADFRNPNGITMDPSGEHLFVAHAGGISRVALADRERCPLRIPEGALPSGIDGLYYHQNALVAVHPGAGEVRRHELDASGKRIVDSRALARDHPAFHIPTTGVLVDDHLYVVANSQFDAFEDGELWPLDRLAEPAIVRIELSP